VTLLPIQIGGIKPQPFMGAGLLRLLGLVRLRGLFVIHPALQPQLAAARQ
jgi:hypothetical protein